MNALGPQPASVLLMAFRSLARRDTAVARNRRQIFSVMRTSAEF
jgi:hypothetical protein